jgi:hypothetical protein
MAVVHPDEPIVRVYLNQAGRITIEQIGDRGSEGMVSIDPRDVQELAHALECVAQEAANAKPDD